ncbi:hypothetical protein GMPD_41780 [Geomonas paludis]|uniref:Uncharacterized protein n=1 Tax=Geomonas paludis TaxID=2740185 RepID=A0A6V8N4N2_9BACT|nr:hypothetical protein GMPD_41780 [Geomonas paludis]
MNLISRPPAWAAITKPAAARGAEEHAGTRRRTHMRRRQVLREMAENGNGLETGRERNGHEDKTEG